MFVAQVEDELQGAPHLRCVECRITVLVGNPSSESGEKGDEEIRLRVIPGQCVALGLAIGRECDGAADLDQLSQCFRRLGHGLAVVDQHELVSDLVGNEPRFVLPADDAFIGELREEVRRDDFVPGPDDAGLGKDGNIIRRAEDEIRSLPGHGRNDERIAHFLSLTVKRHQFLVGVAAVVVRDDLLEKLPLRSRLLVPDDQFIGALPRGGACGGPERQPGR